MNWLVAMGTTVGVVGASIYYGGLNDQQTLLVLGVAAVVLLVARQVLRAHKFRDEEPEPLVNPEGHPSEAVVVGFVRGVIADVLLALSLCVAWGLEFWVPPWGRGVESVDANGPLPAPAIRFATDVVETNYVEPRMVIDVIAKDESGSHIGTLLEEQFALKVNGVATPIASVDVIDHMAMSATFYIRDISGSITQSQPFPQMVDAFTTEIIAQLAADPRHGTLTVVDFAGEEVEVLPWTKELANIRVAFGTPKTLDRSALDRTLIKGIDALASQPYLLKRLTVITDGANNISTAFDRFGIVAHAKSKGVNIHVIALPTQSLQGEQAAMLKMLAEGTGGVYIDGATDNVPTEISRMIKQNRKPQTAYRLIFLSERPVSRDEMVVTFNSN